MRDVHVDVCVIGGGPAGSALAQRLACLGHSTAVVEACVYPRQHVGESLVTSVWPLLEVLGVRDAVERAGFLRPAGTWLRWTGSTEWHAGPAEPGLQVDRARFDAILLDAARASGARVIQPARVIAMKREGDGWIVAAQTPTGPLEISSRIVADASGRRGRLSGRQLQPRPRTLALAAYWTGVASCGAETCVEAGDEQWYWGAPLPGGGFVAAAFVDAKAYRCGVDASGGRDHFFEHLIAQSELLRACLGGRRASSVRVCDASPWQAAMPATVDAIKVGEAAFAIDPLSSQGVQTAIGSALHAAAVVHTIVERPDRAALAVEFYRAAQENAVAFHARAAAAAYSEAAATRPAPFWQQRAVGHLDTDHAATDFRAHLSADSVVQLSDRVRVEAAPVLSGDLIVPGWHVALPGGSGSVAFLGGVELAPLLDIARHPVAVDRLARSWATRVPLDRAVEILSWLWLHGALQRVRCEQSGA